MTDLLVGLQNAKTEAYNLPSDLAISTATITCKIDVLFDVSNIANYFNDFDDIIIGKKYEKNFFNQVSLIFRTSTLMGDNQDLICQKEKLKNINIKLFINGSIQMTGCKHLDNIKKCLIILFEKLKIKKAILNKNYQFKKITFIKINSTKCNFQQNLINSIDDIDINTNKNNKSNINNNTIHLLNTDKISKSNIKTNFETNIINDKIISTDLTTENNDDDDYEDELEKLDIKNVYMFKIRMINTNFNIGFQINRNKLYELLIEEGYDVTFDPIIHSCVNVKYNIKQLNKTVSIFIFESGSITIAGSNSCYQILVTYNFINKLILSNYNYLLSKPINAQLIVQLTKNIAKHK